MKKSVVALFALVSVLCIPFLSCDVEIGLGSSVDTKAPELTIENPPAGSVIRDVFAINGTCSDDGVIESITVDLKQTDNAALSYSFNGTFVQKEGVWSCEINPLNEKTPVPDGSYEATVTITDTAKRETIRTRTYTIDNTAPVLAITRPSSVIPTGSDPKKYSNSDSFGQDFVIEGHVADTCERRFISVDVYDMDSSLVYSTLNAEDESSRLIKIDSDFSTTIASFGDKAYTAIYGDDEDAGAKMFFCEITVYDSAKKYPLDGTEPAGENQLGNSVKYFYMYEGELYNTIFDAYGMTNAYKILNGSFSSDDSRTLNATVSPADAKKDLENTAYQETRGFLSLNPKNNPYFKVSGHEALNKDDESREEMDKGTIFDNTEHHITNNSNIVVEVYPGLDQTPLIQDNLGLYLLPADVNGKPVENAEKVWLIRPLVDKDGNAVITDETEINERKELISKIGSTYKFTVYLSTKKPTPEGKTLFSGERYIFGVQGWDKKGVAVKNAEAVFGFKLVESGTAPALTIKNVTPKWITTNENTPENPDLVDKNAAKTVSVTMAFAGDAPFRLTRIVNETEQVELLTSSDEWRETEYTDSYTPPAGTGSGTIRYILTSNNDLTSTESTDYYVDNIRPEVVDFAVPSVKETEKPSFKFTGTVSDGESSSSSKIAEVQMKLSYVAENDSIVSSNWISVGNTERWDSTIVFQEDDDYKEIFAVEGSKNIEIRTIDNAGNISEVQRGLFIFDTGSPRLTVQNYKMGNNAAQTIKDEFFASDSFTISGTVSDNYEIKSLSIKQIKGEGNSAEELVIPVEIREEGTWTVVNLPRNTEAGKTNEADVDTGIYSYIITATDKADKQTNSATYKVTIDLDSPVVEITSPASSSIEGSTFLFKGTMKDEDGTGISGYSYKFVKPGTDESSVEWTNVNTSSDTWSFYKELAAGNTVTESSLCEGDWSLFVKAKDEAGNECDPVERQFTVDITYPELTETGIGEAGSAVRSGITLSGTTRDSNGIESVVITDNLNAASRWTIDVTAMTADSQSGSYNWSQVIQLGTEANKLGDGNHTLTITATDISGKPTRITRSVIVDTTAPDTLTITSPAADDADGADSISGSSKIFTGNATDDISGLASYSYVFSQSSTAPATGWTTVAAENGNWSINRTVIAGTGASENCLHEGEWYLFIKAKDKAGNETSTPVTRHFWVDQSVPALTNVNIASGTETYFFKTTALTVSGKAIDTHALAANAVVIKKNGTTVASVAETDVGTDGSWQVTLAADIIPDDGTAVALTIEATDIVGKSSGVNTYNVCKDMEAPVTTVSPAADAALSYQKSVNYEFTGTASDANLDDVTAELYKNGTKVDETSLSIDRTANTWKWKVYDLEEAAYNIKVIAKDKADNRTELQSGSIKVDTTAPRTNVNGTSLYAANGTTSVTEITDGENAEAGTYYAQSSYTLSGSVSDANFEYSETSFILKENGIQKTVTFADSGWTYTPASLADGTYTYTITVTDKAQNKTSYSFTVVYDTTAPEVVIASPESTAYSSAPEANGTVRDAGIGIAEVKWSVDNSTWTAANWTNGANWSVDFGTLENEGSVTLYVKAKDKFGREACQNVSFSYDLNNPVVAETDTVTGYKKAGYSFTLTGTAYDTNALSYIEIVDRIGNTVKGTYKVDNDDATADTVTITNGSIAAAKSSETALTWSKTFSYNDAAPLEEGQHTFTITAKDIAGKTSNTVTKTVFVDTVAPQITSALIPDVYDTANPSFRFRGNAQDNENGSADSGIEIVKLKLKSYNSTDGSAPAADAASVNETDWIEASGTTGWIYTAVFSELNTVFNTSGYKKLFVQAKDEAGNESNIYESDYFLYDKAEPAVTLNNYKLNGESNTRTLTNVASAFISNNFTLNATVTDDYRIAAIVVKQGETEIERITDKNGTSESISVANLPRNDGNTGALSLTASGEYVFTITAEDAAGKTVTSSSFTTTVDKEKPVITITRPESDLGTNAAMSQVSYTFRGEASDNDGGSGITKYRYMFNNSASEPAYTDANWSAEQDLTASWSLAQTLVEGNTAVANGLYEGEWYLWMYAVDAAGNKSDIISRHFWVDKNNPVLTTSTVTENSAASNTVVAVSGIYYFDEAISGTASATDSSNTTPAITFWIGNTQLNPSWNGNTWTISSGITENTLHVLTIRATDIVGKVAEKTFSIYKDTAYPAVTIESPAAGSNYQAQEITVRGTTGDAGSGVEKIEYSTDGTNYSALTTFNAGGQSWSTTQQLSVEGDITVYVKATDRLGRTADDNVSFYYDASIPELRETDNVSGPGDAASFTLTGKAWDTNGISRIEITDQSATPVKIYSNIAGSTQIDAETTINWITGNFITLTTPQKTEPNGNNWTATFKVGTDNASEQNYMTDGGHTLLIKAYDIAGRVSESISKTVFVDLVDPVVTIATPDPYINQTTYQFSGTVTEANLTSLNVELFEYVDGTNDISKGSQIVATIANDDENGYDWTYGGYGFTAGKEYYIKVTATDRGTRTDVKDTKNNRVYIDNVAPTSTLRATGLYTTSQSGVVQIGQDDDNQLTESGTYYANGAYTLSGTVTEAKSMGTVKITHNNGTPVSLTLTNNVWSYTGAATTGTHTYTLELKDAANNVKQYTYNVVYDETEPANTFTFQNATGYTGYTKNDTFVFTGTITEANLYSAKIRVYNGNTPGSWETINVNSSNGTWTYTATGLSEGNHKVDLQLTDKANNIVENTAASSVIAVDSLPPSATFAATNITNESFEAASSLTIGNTYYSSAEAGYGIVATIGDTNFDAAHSTITTNGGDPVNLNTAGSGYDSATGKWTVSGVTSTNTYVITLKDLAGNQSVNTIMVRYDVTGPTVQIRNPDKDNTPGTQTYKPNAALDGESFSFRINANDGTGVGMKTVKYKFSNSTASVTNANATAANGWTIDNTAIDGDKFVAMDLISGTTPDLANNKLCEGTWYLHVIGIDKAGNASSDVVRTFIVDKAAPVITTVTANATAVNSNDPYYFNAGNLVLAGNITETYGLATTGAVVITKGSGNSAETLASINASAITNGNWSVTIPTVAAQAQETAQNILADTMTLLTVTVTDKAGKTSSAYKYNVYKDTVAPVINITSITNGDYFAENHQSNVGGTIIDSGSGVNTATYKLERVTSMTESNGAYTYETEATPVVQTKTANATNSGFTLTGSTATITDLLFGNTEGTLLLTVTAQDETGNSSIKKVHFSYDLFKPDLTETTVTANGKTTNTDVTFTGVGYDTNEFIKIEFTDTSVSENVIRTIISGSTGWTQDEADSTITKNGTDYTVRKVNWTQTFAVGNEELADGDHIFKIVAYDKAGKSTELQRTVTIDTVDPAVGTPAVANTLTPVTVGTGDDAKDWYGSANIPLEVTASDTNGSGVAKVEYSRDCNGSAGAGTWTSMILDNNKYTSSVNCSAGENTIYVKVTDNAGNSALSSGKTIYIDTTAPELTAANYSYDGGTAVAVTDSVYVNGSKTLTVSGTYSDTGVGVDVDSLTFKVGNTIITPTTYNLSGNNWTMTFTPTAGGKLKINGNDKLNNAAQEVTPFTIVLDDTEPTISNISLNGAYKPSVSAETYYTNNTNTNFNLTGVAADNTGVESVSVVIKNAAGTQTSITPVLNADGNGSLNNWTFTLTDAHQTVWSGLATSATAVVKVTDKARNEATANVTINFDVDSPYSTHELDSSTPYPKDLYFRIGNQNNESDTDVGGKYAFGTYGNDTSVEIRGRFDDNGSGVKEILYKVLTTEPEQNSSALEALKTSVLDAPDGSFSLKAESEKTVFYTKSNGTTDSKKIKTNFREKITGFVEGNNYLVLVAVDNVGNAAVDTVTVGEEAYPNYIINVDRTAPTLTSATTETIYTNAGEGKTIELSGTVTDDAAGVDKVVIIHPTNTTETELPATVNGNNWSCTLDATILADISGIKSIYAKAYDKAGSGNWTKVEVARVIVDKTNPTITLDTPNDADESSGATGTQINGTIKLTGTASDKIGTDSNNKFTVTRIEYRMTKEADGTAVTNTWAPITTTLMPDFAIASSESFVVNGFDTTKLTDKATYELRAVVEDYACNKTESAAKTVVVDQDTDRPVITLSNLELQSSGRSYLKSTNNLYLSVTDDDGVSEVKYKIGNAEDWTQLTGSSINLGNTDGLHVIKFTVKDKAGNTFDSTSTTDPTPKITDAEGEIVRSGNLELSVVTKKPVVKDIQYSYYDKLKTLGANETDANRWSDWASSIGTLSAEKYSKLKIKLTASSAQTVKEASATYVKDTGSSTISFTCVDDSSGGHEDDGEHDWISNEIVIDNTANLDKSQNIRIRVIDVVPDPLEYTETVSIHVDNKKPVIEIAAPSSLIGQEETIHGEVKNENEVTMYYAVSRYCEMNANGTPNESAVYADTAVQPADTIRKTGEGENEIVLATAWEELIRENTGLKWNVYFDGKLKEGSATEFEEDHTAKLGTYLTEAYLKITTAAAIADTTSPYDSRTPLYFWIKAVDNYGNETIEKQKLNIDPQAERPIVEISYPVNEIKDGVSVAPTLGGTIRLMGTATDNNAAKYVWIQIDHDNNGFDKDDLALLNTVDETDNTKRKHGYKLGQISSNTEKSIADISAVIAANESISDYGIMVDVKGTGWNQTINSNGEFNDANGEATLKITVYATDADATPHKSLPAQQEIKIDSRIPYVEQSSLELVQYGTKNGNVTPVIARRPYTQDAKISGIWYLTGNIKDDDSGIGVIKCNETQRIASSGSVFKDTTDENYWFKPAAHTNNTSQYDYQFSIPIGNLTQGSVGRSEIKLEITENTNNPTTIYPTFSAIYDNKDPVLNTDTTNSLVNLENKVENSNGFYSFRAIASEDKVRVNGEDIEQSGIERIAFYFTRDLEYSLRELDSVTYSEHSSEDDAETHDLFDVMIYHKNKDSDDVASGNMIIDYTSDNSLTKENGLYWRKVSGASISGKTVTITAKDNNIHPKGLAKIKGTIYLIDTVSADGKDITLDEAPGNGTADVLFAICNVIDNGGEKNGKSTSTTQGYGYGYYPVRVGLDDGDLMTENFSNQGTDWIFDASINSKNLPDGPITLHFVAFDKAGNIAEWNSTGFGVANNAPRIAGMTIGVDSNGNGSVDENEFIEDYSNLYALGNDKSGNPMDEVTLPVQTSETTPTVALTIRGITEIRPELVGGNGSITYDYNVYNRNGQTWSTTKEREVEGTEIATGTTDAVAPLKNGKGIELPVSAFIGTTNGADSNWITDGDNKKFEFIFSDSTPGTTIGTKKSNKATLNVIMNVKLREENKAKNWILPFYWKSSTDNSLFRQSKDNGHIEIASDWVFADGYTSNSPAATSGEYDNDPKASGKIKIEGIAQDDTLLRDIKVKFSTAMSTTDGIGTTETTIASYDFDTGKWGTVSGTDESQTFTPFGAAEPTVISESGWTSYVKQATYQDLLDANIIQTLPVVNNVQKKTTDEVQYNTQEYGHIVHWILYLDTEKITGVAATDVTVTATASDRGKPVWSGTAESGTVIYSANETVVTGKPEEGNTPFSGIVTKNESNEPVFGILTGAYRMDVVPYISGIKTSLSSLKKGNSSVYDRTARGHYPVVEDENIYLYGFNLSGATLYDSSVSPKSITLTQIDDITSEQWYVSDLKFNKAFKAIYSTTAPKSDGISKFASGGVYVKVGTIESLNNKNNQNARGSSTETTSSTTGDKSVYDNYYNRQPNGDNNNLLTDDVILDIWKINSEAGKPKSGPLSQPVMAINPKNKQVGFAFANGALRFSMGSLDKSYDFWEYGLDFWTSIGFAYDANGNSFGTAAGGDINATKADAFGIFTSRWTGKGWTASTNGHNNGTGQLRLELIGQAESSNGSSFNGDNVNKERIKSPSIATTVASADATDTNVYLAYYDAINNEIRFKWGILSDSNNIVRKGRIYYAGKDSYYNSINDTTSSYETGLFADYYGPTDSDGSDNNTKDTTTKTVSLTGTKVVASLPYTLEYVSLIAGQTTDKKTFVPGDSGTKYTANTAVMTNEATPRPVCAGQYVSIAAKYQGGATYNITYDTVIEEEVPDVDPDTGEVITDEEGNEQTHIETHTVQQTVPFTDDLVVAVWYDATNNQMLYSYNRTPQKIETPTYKGNNYYRKNNDGTYSGIDSFSQSATGWSTPVAIFGEGNGIGEYCKVVMDSVGRVHIACYDNANADVWYACINNAIDPENTTKKCIVDSYGIVGTELSIDVALKNGKPVPYISYYGSSCTRPKVAYWAEDESIITAASLDGAKDEKFTESWETSIIPSSSKISIDHINVGLWKDSNGNLTDSKKTDGKVGSTSSGNNDGTIWGNGSMNPILGYAITKNAGGYIETAQMK